jgi:chitin disaccharide deacetylase
MMGAPATDDAVRRAREMPSLRVGLHLVLADGSAVLAPPLIPDIADASGRMDGRMFARGVSFFARPAVRRQLEAEIRAQFAAFARTGLTLDHVNVHKHFHLHPTILSTLLRVGREFGALAVRVPHEPVWFGLQAGGPGAAATAALLAPWVAFMKRRLRAAGATHNDRVFGIAASGAMDEARMLEVAARLPAGITEIYLHPATASGSAIAPSMHGYRHAAELAALLSPRVRAAISASGIALGSYADIGGSTAASAA